MDFAGKFEAIARKSARKFGLTVRRIKGCSASELKRISLVSEVPEVPEEYLRLFRNGRMRGKKHPR